ncbi:MAG: hypothetical protein LC792_07290, partial [Actinobacteria bacterium]|nr:hypothetical protein [Actinomycetota bacterium]
PEFLFDATSPPPIAAAIERGLTDEAFRARLLAASGRPPTTCTAGAAATVYVYERVLAGELLPPQSSPLPRVRAAAAGATGSRRARVAVVAPLPSSGDAGDWNAALITELANDPDLEVSAFVERPDGTAERATAPVAPSGVAAAPLAGLEPAEGAHGPFDAVVYCLADDEHHTGSLGLLRRRRDGIVVTRSAHLATLYSAAARAGALPEGLHCTIAEAYGDAVIPGAGAHGTIDAGEARRLGVLLIRDVVAHSRRVLVTDPTEAALARLDAGRDCRDRIDAVDDDPAALVRALKSLVGQGATV